MRAFYRQDRCGDLIHNTCFFQWQFYGLHDPPCFPFSNKSDCLAQFPTRTSFKKVQWRWSKFWVPRFLPMYYIYAVYELQDFFSNDPQLQEASWASVHARIFLTPVTSWTRFRITVWKTTTRSDFFFQDRIPPRSAAMAETTFLLTWLDGTS